jgi:two-component system, cell cycle sensor histidine kinase and response regulator CckA
VLSYCAFLLEQVDAGGILAEDVYAIKTAAERGAALTTQLLAFSRQRVQQVRLLDVNETIGEMLRTVRTLMGNDVAVETRLRAELPKVKMTVGHLEQIIMNLAINARDAMPTGGKLLLSTELVEGRVILSVTDNGAGMNASTRARVFEPFFTTKPEGKGTGLGLAIVFGIVSQSEGRIELESELGRGSTFHIHLPAAAQRSESPRRHLSERAPCPAGRETILLVEDDDALRVVLARKLRSSGYEVVEAGSGDRAIEALERRPGDVAMLVTDVVLPGMSGAVLARTLQARMPALRALFMSGYIDTSAHGDVPVGGPHFLQKPFTPDAFAKAVRGVLDEGEIGEA